MGLNVSRQRARLQGGGRWGVRAHLRLRTLAGIRTRALVVRRPALALGADIHKLIRSHRVDEVTQVLVVKVARQEAGHVDLKRCNMEGKMENNEIPAVFLDDL